MDNRTRTGDIQNHNLALYHLSYIHHGEEKFIRSRAGGQVSDLPEWGQVGPISGVSLWADVQSGYLPDPRKLNRLRRAERLSSLRSSGSSVRVSNC